MTQLYLFVRLLTTPLGPKLPEGRYMSFSPQRFPAPGTMPSYNRSSRNTCWLNTLKLTQELYCKLNISSTEGFLLFPSVWWLTEENIRFYKCIEHFCHVFVKIAKTLSRNKNTSVKRSERCLSIGTCIFVLLTVRTG